MRTGKWERYYHQQQKYNLLCLRISQEQTKKQFQHSLSFLLLFFGLILRFQNLSMRCSYFYQRGCSLVSNHGGSFRSYANIAFPFESKNSVNHPWEVLKTVGKWRCTWDICKAIWILSAIDSLCFLQYSLRFPFSILLSNQYPQLSNERGKGKGRGEKGK